MKNKDKRKCIKIVKKLLGESFYFVHGSRMDKIKKILESGEIKRANEVPENSTFFGTGDDSPNLDFSPYVYCWAKFDDIENKITGDESGFISSLCISPLILLKENVIFNSYWAGEPMQETSLNEIKTQIKNNVNSSFSIYLNKDDSAQSRIKKIKFIKQFIINRKKEGGIYIPHEFLFENRINIKSYLIGIYNVVFSGHSSDSYHNVDKIMKDKYPTIKTYNLNEKFDSEYFQPLIDMCPT